MLFDTCVGSMEGVFSSEEGDTDGSADGLTDRCSVAFLVSPVGVSDELGCCVGNCFFMDEEVDGVGVTNKLAVG